MGKIIRRTVTITITLTESWTIVWLPGADPLHHSPPVGPAPSNTREEQDEMLQITLISADPGKPSVGNPKALTPVALDAPSDGVTVRSSAGGQRKRVRSRRTKRINKGSETDVFQTGEFT